MARENMNNAREIVSLYKKGKLSGEEVYRSANKNNIVIIVTDEKGFIIHAYDDMGVIDDSRVDSLNYYVHSIGANIHKSINESAKKEIDFRIEDEESGQSALFYGAYAKSAQNNEGA